jgi:hypothetical protein
MQAEQIICGPAQLFRLLSPLNKEPAPVIDGVLPVCNINEMGASTFDC